MNNDRLRIVMIRIMVVFVIICIGGIYLRNGYIQEKGASQTFFGSPENFKTETYDNGSIKAQGALKDGYQKDGDWTYFREDGSVEAIETYKDGKLIKVQEGGKTITDSSLNAQDTVKK